MAAILHPCPDVLLMKRMIELQTTIKPATPAGRRGEVAMKVIRISIRNARLTMRDGAGEQESEDSSSDSDDESSDDGRGTSEGAQHLEEVYSRVLRALHKTAKIMCIRLRQGIR